MRPLAVFALLLSLTTAALSIWNLVECGRALKAAKCGGKDSGGGVGPSVVVSVFDTVIDRHGGNTRKFLIGSMVCSSATLATGGLFPPIPHLVFAILGQETWDLQSAKPCGSSTPPSLHTHIYHSLVVLWFSFAASIALMCICRSCSLGCDDGCCVEVEFDTGHGVSVQV